MDPRLALVALLAASLAGCLSGAPSSAPSDGTVNLGATAIYRTDAPDNRSYQVELGFEDVFETVRRDGLRLEGYRVHTNRSLYRSDGSLLWNASTYPGSVDRDTFRQGVNYTYARGHAGYLHLLPDGPRDACPPLKPCYEARSQWFPDEDSAGYLPQVEGPLFAWVPTLHWGFEDRTGTVNGERIRQTVARDDGRTEVRLEMAGVVSEAVESPSNLSARLTFRDAPLPARMTVDYWGTTWILELVGYEPGTGEPIRFGGTSPPAVQAPEAMEPMGTWSMPGRDWTVTYPPVGTDDYDVEGAFQAAALRPEVAAAFRDRPHRFLTYLSTGRGRQIPEPVPEPVPVRNRGWTLMTSPASVSESTDVEYTATVVHERGSTERTVFSPGDGGTFTWPAWRFSPTDDPVLTWSGARSLLRNATAVEDPAIDQDPRWWTVLLSNEYGDYLWFVSANCLRDEPGSIVVVDAATGLIKYGYVDGGYVDLSTVGCSTGTLPPINVAGELGTRIPPVRPGRIPARGLRTSGHVLAR